MKILFVPTLTPAKKKKRGKKSEKRGEESESEKSRLCFLRISALRKLIFCIASGSKCREVYDLQMALW